MDLGIKNAGGHPPTLGGPSIRGYRYLYTMRRASDPSGDEARASCALKVDSTSLTDGTHELVDVGHGSSSAWVFAAFDKRLSSACCSVRWLARYENPPELVKGKAGLLVVLGPAGLGELGDCLFRCLDENARRVVQ